MLVLPQKISNTYTLLVCFCCTVDYMCLCTSSGIMVCSIFQIILAALYGFRVGSMLLTLHEVWLKIETSHLVTSIYLLKIG
jgi:hypothetical protein